MEQNIALIPEYFKHFQCIGPNCEDICCKRWTVFVDESTYKKYQTVRGELTEKIQKYIVRNKKNKSAFDYATILYENHGYCPFLTEDKWCEIHKELGAEYLPPVCNYYPRNTNIVYGKFERFLALSCPEAVRLALLNPEGIGFEEQLIDIENFSIQQYIDEKQNQLSEELFWKIRIFVIRLLQNRTYTLNDRLVLLGLFVQKLDQLILRKQLNKIDNLLKDFNIYIESHELDDQLSLIPTTLHVQIGLLNALLGQTVINGTISKAFIECHNAFVEGLGVQDEINIEEILEKYKQGYQQYLQPFVEKKGYILENYVVHYVFEKLFPYFKKNSCFNEYVLLIIHYALIKMYLIGMAHYEGKLDEEMVVKLIYSFTRAFDHNPKILESCYNYMIGNNFNQLSYMSILIKN